MKRLTGVELFAFITARMQKETAPDPMELYTELVEELDATGADYDRDELLTEVEALARADYDLDQYFRR